MDHGIWPLVTTLLYIQQTGDLKILLEKTPYFRDQQLCRSQEIDRDWRPEDGGKLKTKNGRIYQGTLLEHILVENLVQFFNVGPHNYIRLENADWNDGLDMAAEYGESVAFSAMYAQNLSRIADVLRTLGEKKIVVLKETKILLDSLTQKPIDYANIKVKRKILNNYFQAVKFGISGKKIAIPTDKLIRDLEKKAVWLSQHIQKTAWLKEGFFNGYYDNAKKRVEGKINGAIRMTLTGQVFPVMSGIATREQIKILFQQAKKYLKEQKLGGLRLNTDFKDEQLNLGRAFSFVYGDKENGSFFSHMAVMFSYALYSRGFAQAGYTVLNSLYKMALDTESSKIYPCLPEYFNAEGRGMYGYLTGSASWFILTILTQVFGIRGEYGDFLIEPKLTAQQFKAKNGLSIATSFAERKIEVRFINPHKKDFGKYSIRRVKFNGKVIAQNLKSSRFLFSRKEFLRAANKPHNIIEVILF
jgi:cellobiose phosphorylase